MHFLGVNETSMATLFKAFESRDKRGITTARPFSRDRGKFSERQRLCRKARPELTKMGCLRVVLEACFSLAPPNKETSRVSSGELRGLEFGGDQLMRHALRLLSSPVPAIVRCWPNPPAMSTK